MLGRTICFTGRERNHGSEPRPEVPLECEAALPGVQCVSSTKEGGGVADQDRLRWYGSRCLVKDRLQASSQVTGSVPRVGMACASFGVAASSVSNWTVDQSQPGLGEIELQVIYPECGMHLIPLQLLYLALECCKTGNLSLGHSHPPPPSPSQHCPNQGLSAKGWRPHGSGAGRCQHSTMPGVRSTQKEPFKE